MPRRMLTDKAWEVLKQILQSSGRVYNKFEHRNTIEGILFRMRTGIQWRDLPPEFGQWNTVFRRFNLWSKKGVIQNIFQVLAQDNDAEWLFIDGSIVKAHQDSCGAASADEEAIGKSRGGNSTQIHLAVDSGGLPVYFELSGGQVNDIVHAQSLISGSPNTTSVCADKGGQKRPRYLKSRLISYMGTVLMCSEAPTRNMPQKAAVTYISKSRLLFLNSG